MTKTPDDQLKDFILTTNDAYKGNVMNLGSEFSALDLRRFSSGSLTLDIALGGGWPFGRISIIGGMESTGKTAITLKAMKSLQDYDRTTRMHREFVPVDKFQPCRALFVDLEGTFDPEWATALGVDLGLHLIARPEYQQQAIDIISKAIRENLVDLIIVDSIASMSPMEEINASSEEHQIGLTARKNNQAFRKWVGSLNLASQQNETGGPAMIFLNQFRINIGQFIGDPRTLPGGKGQVFAASIIIYTMSPDYEDTKSEAHEACNLKGVTAKNKTFIPKRQYKFKFFLKDSEKGTKGHVDNIKPLMDEGKELGIINTGKEVKFGKYVFRTQAEMKARLAVDPALYRLLWRSVIKLRCNTMKI